MNCISVKNVSYKYPYTEGFALKELNYEFEKGKCYGIIGANGSGKTTFCNLLRGMIPHFFEGELTGDVFIEETDVRNWDSNLLSTKIGYIFQNPFTQISGIKETVFEEIALGLENLGMEKEALIDRVIEVVKLLKLEQLIKKNPNNLSGGQKQRVAFASIIAMNNDIIVIDEPTSQLDPESTAEIFSIINLLRNQGKTIFLVEHKVDLIAEYSDEVIVLKDGQITLSGSTQEVLSNMDLLQMGVMLPQASMLSYDMQKANKQLDSIAITKSQVIEQIKQRVGV
ncbi:energy-coupling factor ABC transporter ATP-binding protein [Psychrobacillus soli]|uniref:ABC transporter ATP-binding protein n=1 Tax=Psychrobacillus soli TaxID=1543965 RepID=A0A544TGB3_9BACI|nr:ABC transporter ATP-binding protein [Psychrobacillus soli]TQR16494.1 ABC transporter ATP-binding protein [Psychrobacillus soli]